MEEPTATASAVINFAEKLEDESTSFYEKLAKKFIENREAFLSLSEESKKNKVLVTRTYRETITDALEACFSFKGFNPNDYVVKMPSVENMSYSDSLKLAIQLEEKACRFYSDVAERGRSLLATIAMAFKKAAETRNTRKLKLKSLLEDLTR